MSLSRREFMIKGAAAAAALTLLKYTASDAHADVTSQEVYSVPPKAGPYQPSWESLAQYECPEWFRDAKLGLWAHWSAQCVPEQGDWYARLMYQEGSDDYNFHIANYGHPSKVGFKEIDHSWKAENWNPEQLISLYKAAGAKYFVALANHHDNLDCFDSQYQPWNTTKVGPMKDLVGTWAKTARAAGLRFGVTCHGSRTWSWMEPAQGSDSVGSFKGVPYDGLLTKADGAGLWWDGLDPEDLYAQHHKPMGSDFNHWSNWLNGDLPSKPYCEKFYNRVTDLIDKYHPDLLYFDDQVLPLYEISDIGLRIAAYHYNASCARNNGTVDVVLNGKGLNDDQMKCMIQDYERGQSDTIKPHPWQTDTCIGDWHYKRSIYLNHQYKSADQVVKMLVDIVSKNGNLLLNIPVRGDGTIDPDEVAFVQSLGAWMAVNQEAIHGSRPWKIWGEGPVKLGGGAFGEGGENTLSFRDIRFTTKRGTLYAAAMGWPETGKLLIRSLNPTNGIVGRVRSVELLGAGKVSFQETDDGLVITLPQTQPCNYVYLLKIRGLDLDKSTPQPLKPTPITAGSDGSLLLLPELAQISGGLRLQGAAVPNIGSWNSSADCITWTVHFDRPGIYNVSLKASSESASSVTVAVQNGTTVVSVEVPVANTGSWDTYQTFTGVQLNIALAGDCTVVLKPTNPNAWEPINAALLTFTPA